MVMHYFQTILEHGLPPSLNLNHNAYSNFFTHSREAWKHGTQHIGTFYLCQSLVNGLYHAIKTTHLRKANQVAFNVWKPKLNPRLMFSYEKKVHRVSFHGKYYYDYRLLSCAVVTIVPFRVL